jgi:hypothetical protein
LRCSEEDTYYCGRLLSGRNVESKAERYLGNTFVCLDCSDEFDEFLGAVRAPATREAEWEGV